MAISVNTPTVGTTTTTSVTVPSGTELLVVTVSIKPTTGGTISAIFNTTETLTLIGSYNEGTMHNAILYLVNPTATTANVVISYTGTIAALRVGICSVTGGIDTASPVGNSQFNETSADPITRDITTTNSTGVVFDAVMNNNGNNIAFSVGANQTEIYNVTQMISNRGGVSSYEIFTSSGTKTMSWSGGTPTSGWAYAVVEFKGVAATSGKNFFMFF